MISQRSTHYFLWFLLFGVLFGFAKGFNSEAIVVSITGALGILSGLGLGETRIARIYDLVVGLVFAGLGLLGILTSFPNISHQIGISTSGAVLGLYLAIPYSLIHTVLGLTSLNHSFKATVTPATTTVATPIAS